MHGYLIRIDKAIKGYRNLRGLSVPGLGGNLKYFRTDFIDSEPTDKNKKRLVNRCTEMLCLKENCFDEIKSGKNFKVFENDSNEYLGIIYDDDGIDDFKQVVKKLNKYIVVYVFSLDESAREEEFQELIPLVSLKPIPEVILNVYRRIFS
jgi:adenine-specific DNA-methyltransferase